MKNDYYVYALLDPRKQGIAYAGIPFEHQPKYIGKGRGDRAYASAFREAKFTDSPKARWVRRLRKDGYEPILVFVERDMREADSFNLERALVKTIGRKNARSGPLLNQTDGGEGGKHAVGKALREYDKMLEGSGLSRVGELVNFEEYQPHTCVKHGGVLTAPKHVKARHAKGRPLCPKCGIAARGKIGAKVKQETFGNQYRELFAHKCQPAGYKILGKFTRAIDPLVHSCPRHGKFSAKPHAVTIKVKQGLTCCPKCNREDQVIGDVWSERNALARKAHLKLLQGTGYRLIDQTDFTKSKKLKHTCKRHGEFVNSAKVIEVHLRNGRTPCPHCNIETRNTKNAVNASKGGRRKKLKETS